MSTFTFKLADGFRVIHSNGIQEVENFEAIFTDLFGWDLEHDELAQKCYDAVFREVFCFGRCDLSRFTDDGKTLVIEVIPPQKPCVKYIIRSNDESVNSMDYRSLIYGTREEAEDTIRWFKEIDNEYGEDIWYEIEEISKDEADYLLGKEKE